MPAFKGKNLLMYIGVGRFRILGGGGGGGQGLEYLEGRGGRHFNVMCPIGF